MAFEKIGSKIDAIFTYQDADGMEFDVSFPYVDEAKAPTAVAAINTYILANKTMFARQPASLVGIKLRKVETLEASRRPK